MYDLIIIGGGVAAFTSALFAGRRGLKILVIAKDIGGQANYTDLIENFPGINATGGFELVQKIRKQALEWDVTVLDAEVQAVKQAGSGFVATAYGKQYKSNALILAFGKSPMDLNVPGEQEFKGRGVSYCVSCDGPLYKSKAVAVAGMGNIGLEAALQLSKHAKKVYTLSKTDKLVGHPALLKALKSKRNIELVPFARIDRIVGDNHVHTLNLTNLQTRQKWTLKIAGLFVELGYVVNSLFVQDLVKIDELGQILVNSDQSTSTPGVFAAGDATDRHYKQAVISAGEAATAALAAYDWLMRQHGGEGLSSDWTEIKKIKK